MHRQALVVGINYYFSHFKKLNKPAADAEAVAKMLEEHGDFRVDRLPLQQKAGGSRQVLLCDGDRPPLRGKPWGVQNPVGG